MTDEQTDITFAELDMLCDLDPLNLTVENLDRLILGMRAYRANAMAKGSKATKFSDEAGISIDIKAMSVKMREGRVCRRLSRLRGGFDGRHHRTS